MASQGRGARAKGSGYELKTAKFMSPWWGGNFNRTPGSGGLRWGSDQSIAGDIVPPKGMLFPFVIECKKHEGWSIEHILLNTGKPKEWFSQVVMDARRVKKVPMLIFSRNRAKDFVMVPYQELLYADLIQKGNHDVMRTSITIKNIRDEIQVFDVIVTTLDTLALFTPDYLRAYAANLVWDNYADEY